jgi:hypothetical protein
MMRGRRAAAWEPRVAPSRAQTPIGDPDDDDWGDGDEEDEDEEAPDEDDDEPMRLQPPAPGSVLSANAGTGRS